VEGGSTDVRFETTFAGRSPVAPDNNYQFSATTCSQPTAVVVIAVDSQEPLSAPQLAFLGKTLVLEATVVDQSLRLSPAESTLQFGETLQFSAQAPGVENPTFTWEATGGDIDQDGLFTAGFVPGDFLVTVTLQETGDSSGASVTIEGTAITITPGNITLSPGETAQFSAEVLGPANTNVIWTAEGGSIDATGLYTAGDSPGDFFVTATSVADPSVVAVSTVSIGPGMIEIGAEYRGTATDSRFPNAIGAPRAVRIYVLELAAGGFRVTFHYDYRENLGRGVNVQEYRATLDGATLSGFRIFGSVVLDPTIVWFATVNGNIMTGRTPYSVPPPPFIPQCPDDGCYWEFEVTRFP
jgi:hypothetical protein